MKRVLIALLLASTASNAQQSSGTHPPEQMVQRLFILKYAEPSQLAGLLSVFNANIRQNSELHAITVEASADAMHGIEDAIQKLDVPSATPKNVEMTVYLLVASDSAVAGSPIPKDLDAVTTQLKNTFPFKNYGLLDVITFQARTGQNIRTTSSGGSLPIGGRAVAVITQININSIALQGDGRTLRVERLNAQFRVPQGTGGENFNYLDLQMQTDLDIKEGQKVVVGRLGITHEQALFLVMVGKVL